MIKVFIQIIKNLSVKKINRITKVRSRQRVKPAAVQPVDTYVFITSDTDFTVIMDKLRKYVKKGQH